MMPIRDPSRCPTHPGELLREDVIPSVGQPKTVIARGLGISRQQLNDIWHAERAVDVSSAPRLVAA